MKKIFKENKLKLSLLVLPLLITGCGVVPEKKIEKTSINKFNKKVELNGVSKYEGEILLNNYLLSLKLINTSKRPKANCTFQGKWSTNHIMGGSDLKVYDACYFLRGNYITRETSGTAKIKSLIWKNKWSYDDIPLSNEFISYVYGIDKSINNDFDTIVSDYAKFKKEFKKLEEKTKTNIKTLKPKIIDNTKILSKSYLKNSFSYNSSIANLRKPIRVYKDFNLSNISELFKVSTSIDKKKKDRFDIKFKERFLRYDLKGDNFRPTFIVDKVKFNYLPEYFFNKDKSISIEVNNKSMNIVNLTNNYINIESVSMYYNDNIKTIKNLNLKLPPQSVEKNYNISSLEHYNNKLIEVKSKNQKVNYGFAISYYNQDVDKRNTLYKTKNYTINSFK